jgi:hypothetical protein
MSDSLSLNLNTSSLDCLIAIAMTLSWSAVTSSGSRDVTWAHAVRSPGVGPVAAAAVISIASNSAGDDDCRDESLSSDLDDFEPSVAASFR